MAGEIQEPDLRNYRNSKQATAKPAPGPMSAAQYQLRAEVSDLEAKKARLIAETAAAEKVKREAMRYSRLESLRNQGHEFEVATHYGLTADYSDEQFDRHCQVVLGSTNRLPIGSPTLPVMEDDPTPKHYSLFADVTDAEQEEAVRYGRDHSLDFKAALKAIRSKSATSSVK